MNNKGNSSFTFLTWNLCLLQNSHAAPASWRIDQAEAEVRKLVLTLEPDFVFFQELPGMVPFVETHDMVPASTISHSGNIATIAKNELMESLESKPIGRFAVLTTVKQAGISFANVHLEPGKNGDSKRLQMLDEIAKSHESANLIVVGDTNTRVEEEEAFRSQGFSGERPPKATWDSRRNKYREKGRAYTAYYTRYFHSENVKVDQVKVWDKPLEFEGKKFHLSDHYAMSGRCTVAP